MKERPILFNGQMVRALLDGSKTQTRRIMKHQAPSWVSLAKMLWGVAAEVLTAKRPISTAYAGMNVEGCVLPHYYPCPYGQPGDRLWVRESFWGCDLPGFGDQPCVVYDDEWFGKDYLPAEPRPWARKFGRVPSNPHAERLQPHHA